MDNFVTNMQEQIVNDHNLSIIRVYPDLLILIDNIEFSSYPKSPKTKQDCMKLQLRFVCTS